MRIKQVRMLTFDELSEERKQKEIDKYRENVCAYDDWDDWVIERFLEDSKAAGFGVDRKKIYYDVYMCTCTFSSTIDIPVVLESMDPKHERWPVLHILKDDIYMHITTDNNMWRGGKMYIEICENMYDDMDEEDLLLQLARMQRDATPEEQLEEFKDELWETVEDMANKLLKDLREEMEYQESDEVIIENIKANDLEFEEEVEE